MRFVGRWCWESGQSRTVHCAMRLYEAGSRVGASVILGGSARRRARSSLTRISCQMDRTHRFVWLAETRTSNFCCVAAMQRLGIPKCPGRTRISAGLLSKRVVRWQTPRATTYPAQCWRCGARGIQRARQAGFHDPELYRCLPHNMATSADFAPNSMPLGPGNHVFAFRQYIAAIVHRNADGPGGTFGYQSMLGGATAIRRALFSWPTSEQWAGSIAMIRVNVALRARRRPVLAQPRDVLGRERLGSARTTPCAMDWSGIQDSHARHRY